MPPKPDKSLMRSLGEFVGHIVRGAMTPVDPPKQRREVKREVQEEVRDAPGGKITLRRTTIEEVEFEPDENQKDSGPPGPPGQE